MVSPGIDRHRPRASGGCRSSPGLAIAIAVMGFNLVGDGLRDLLDPREEALTMAPILDRTRA